MPVNEFKLSLYTGNNLMGETQVRLNAEIQTGFRQKYLVFEYPYANGEISIITTKDGEPTHITLTRKDFTFTGPCDVFDAQALHQYHPVGTKIGITKLKIEIPLVLAGNMEDALE